MRNRILPLTALLGSAMVLSHAVGQQAPKMSESELRESLAIMKVQAAKANAQVRTLTEQAVELDKRIEKRVGQIVDYLSTLQDSVDSKTKVINTKQDVMQGLKSSIEFYAQRRNMLRSELNRRLPEKSKGEMAEDVAILDEKIETRIDQILELTTSLTGHQGYQKYRLDPYGYARGRHTTDAYRKGRRVESKTVNTKEAVESALGQSIEGLERRNQDLESNLPRMATEADRERARQEIARNEELIEKRRAQGADVITSSPRATKKVGGKEATALDRKVQEAIGEIQRDADTLVRLVTELDTQRSRSRSLQNQIGYIRKELEKSP